MPTPKNQHVAWLSVENDDNDAFLMQRALARVLGSVALYRVRNGAQARAYLAGDGIFADRSAFPLPALILSDLRMPLMNGLELLAWVKQHPKLCRIPFVVLTSSNHATDLDQAQSLGVADYLIKPHDPQDLIKLIQVLATRFSLDR
jgi:CheY-like chemotaxis protein